MLKVKINDKKYAEDIDISLAETNGLLSIPYVVIGHVARFISFLAYISSQFTNPCLHISNSFCFAAI